VRDLNIENIKGYSDLIKKGNPDFVEVKSYMHVGASQKRLKRSNMLFHNEVVEFSKELNKFLPDYEIVSEHVPSCVVLLAKKKFKINGVWNIWIDFEKFFALANSKKEINKTDYLRKTPTEFVI